MHPELELLIYRQSEREREQRLAHARTARDRRERDARPRGRRGGRQVLSELGRGFRRPMSPATDCCVPA